MTLSKIEFGIFALFCNKEACIKKIVDKQKAKFQKQKLFVMDEK